MAESGKDSSGKPLCPVQTRALKCQCQYLFQRRQRGIPITKEELKFLYEKIDSQIIKEFTTPILNDIGVMMNFGRLKERVKKYPESEKILAFAVNNKGNVESAKGATDFIKILEVIKQNENLKMDFQTLSQDELFEKYHSKETFLINIFRNNNKYDFQNPPEGDPFKNKRNQYY